MMPRPGCRWHQCSTHVTQGLDREVWRVAQEQSRGPRWRLPTHRRCDRNAGFEPLHQLFQHENRARNRRIERGGQTGTVTGRDHGPPDLARLASRHIALPVGVTQRLAVRGDMGWMKLRGAGKGFHGRIITQHEIEHRAQEMRVSRGRLQGFRTDSAFGEEKAETLGVSAMKESA